MRLFTLHVALAITLVTLACSGGQSSQNPGNDESHDEPAGDTSAAPGAPMSDFQKALSHFRKAAAARLNQPESQIKVVPDAENQVRQADIDLAPFIAFFAPAGNTQVRGLASPTGVVAQVSQGKLEGAGPLLEAARALDPAGALPAAEIAKRIVWLHGPNFRLIGPGHDGWKATAHPPANLSEPKLTHKDGSAELRFFVNEAGQSGVVVAHEIVVQVAPGYQATVTSNRAAP